MKELDGGRISIAALSLEYRSKDFKSSIKYSKEEKQFENQFHNFKQLLLKVQTWY